MLTWRLWHTLRNPPYDHPLFSRITRATSPSSRLIQAAGILVIYLVICLGLTLVWPLLVSQTFLTLGLLVLGFNTLYALAWTSTISATIAHEYEQDTYTLLCLLPTGPVGIGWVLSTARLHSTPLFHNLRVLLRIISIALIGALLIALIIPLLVIFTPGQPGLSNLLQMIFHSLLLAAAFYLDHVQSLVLATLLGMLTPTYTQNRLNAQLWSMLGFLLLQILVYLFMVIAGIGLLQLTPAAAILLLGLFYGLRETLLIVMWRLLNHSLA